MAGQSCGVAYLGFTGKHLPVSVNASRAFGIVEQFYLHIKSVSWMGSFSSKMAEHHGSKRNISSDENDIQKKRKTKITKDENIKMLEDEFSRVVDDKPLWLKIVRYLDRDTLKVIDDMSELQGMGLLVKAERRTVDTIEDRRFKYCKLSSLLDVEYSESDPQKLLIEVEEKKDFWYSWGADKAGFGSRANLHEFCEFAGIANVVVKTYFGMNTFHFFSEDKKVMFTCRSDPRNNNEAYVHYFGMTGKRERVKWLASWFHSNCVWGEICYGGREFI